MNSMTIFGDSWVAAANRGRPGYARLTPLLLARVGQFNGAGGTGFVATSGERLAYSSRLDQLAKMPSDLLLLQASGNDAPHDFAEVESAADSFLRQAMPHFQRTVVLGPLWAGEGRERLPQLRDVIASAASRHGVPFIDGLDWMRERDMGPDPFHPSWRGHLRLARKVARAVRNSQAMPTSR
jgi:lysophospholipase L1-like esterase